MAKVILPSFIRSLSGQIGNLCFRTSASGKTSVYLKPERTRKTPVSQKEMQARERFAERVRQVNNIMLQDPLITRKQAWIIVKQLPS